MQPRPPIVTILGHVDHGKTTLLDYIRKTNLTSREHGGITQSIGVYEIATKIKGYQTDKITFIDTPGHEAFTKLRSRGANIADIALLLIDAKDSLKPQTVESISHIKAANIPFIVVLNKTDLPEAKPDKVKADLLKHEVIVEDKGGKVPCLSISAKTGKGVNELLESILLLASELHLQFDPQAPAIAYIIETRKDKRGVIASCIIKEGQMKITDVVFSDNLKTKIRSLVGDTGKPLKTVSPSTPFELLGFSELPEVGSTISPIQSPKQPKQPQETQPQPALDVHALLNPQEEKKVSLIIKADTQGSLEAILNSFVKNKNVEIILNSVGDINNSDIFLAKSVKAIVIGFNIKPSTDVIDLAKQEKVIIKTYNIIYELIEELTEVASLLKEKEESEKNLKGEAKVLATFIIEGEKVYGIKVTKGKANLGDSVEFYRDKNLVSKSKIVSLRLRSKPVEEVKKDQEAGVILSPQLDIRTGDMIKLVL